MIVASETIQNVKNVRNFFTPKLEQFLFTFLQPCLAEDPQRSKNYVLFLKVPAKNCCKRKLVQRSIILVLRMYWGISSFRFDKAVGRFLILVKCPRDSRKKSDWFCCKKIWNIWTSNPNRAKDNFSSCSIGFTTLHTKTFADIKEKRKWKSSFTP